MKTAAELQISQAELDALVKVEAGLRSGRYKHVTDEQANGNERFALRAKYEGAFNMGVGCYKYSCGQVGCIGGWVAYELGMDPVYADRYVQEAGLDSDSYGDLPIRALYFPHTSEDAWEDITPLNAADAIRDFLDTGDPKWDAEVD